MRQLPAGVGPLAGQSGGTRVPGGPSARFLRLSQSLLRTDGCPSSSCSPSVSPALVRPSGSGRAPGRKVGGGRRCRLRLPAPWRVTCRGSRAVGAGAGLRPGWSRGPRRLLGRQVARASPSPCYPSPPGPRPLRTAARTWDSRSVLGAAPRSRGVGAEVGAGPGAPACGGRREGRSEVHATGWREHRALGPGGGIAVREIIDKRGQQVPKCKHPRAPGSERLVAKTRRGQNFPGVRSAAAELVKALRSKYHKPCFL